MGAASGPRGGGGNGNPDAPPNRSNPRFGGGGDPEAGLDEGEFERTYGRPLSFPLAVYSFVFGEGDPNFDIKGKRMRHLASLICAQGGAVCEQELLPFECAPGEAPPSGGVSPRGGFPRPESLSALAALGGTMLSAPDGDRVALVFDPLPPCPPNSRADFLEETLHCFSRATPNQQKACIVLGIVNLILNTIVVPVSLSLAARIQREGGLGSMAPLVVMAEGVLTTLRPFLLVYSLLFFAIPFARFYLLKHRNGKILQRNALRKEAAAGLQRPSRDVAASLEFARMRALGERPRDENVGVSAAERALEAGPRPVYQTLTRNPEEEIRL
eukprot:CAMPEP_0206263034 /NCGR_PEP_ID=MMETSP0047_2-20121206/28588_1 /ASSEMBLY_ACC=CAM_ASM_000192 /TAXON_ID=195065 /ORGANISM="Chroomonas mesostigmatica_cf, Strain CCMP1168" /LENGTH=327 /DNA_ID=CAMNT_0053690519 /DNA_START=12 /DNA_END=992 /DNA_ORIENTATION=+